ncbi:uncharacterized protein LOC111020220 isoform X2 [Momordica charantia]|uniref:Uncharacterized protein LOC111020220 isoform X2 n=1 Tax=Momordica charantia TaxID=3673 RepID=A0A6J1DGG2_MOMCH|nr:uncharacterized protein LOC111020220 isoform X2 [Momordica charantia]
MSSFSLTTPYSTLHCSTIVRAERSFNEATTSVLQNRNLFPISTKLLRISSRRRRFHVNSVHSDAETEEPRTQYSREKNAVSSGGSSLSTSFLSYLCPLLKLFAGGDPSGERNFTLEVATSSLSTLARLPWGSRTVSDNSRSTTRNTNLGPLLPLQLYEFEACPFCRRVREALTELDLAVECDHLIQSNVYPCPKGSIRHRDIVKKCGGKEQFPFLTDPNTGTSMYESGDIVKYLFQQYGNGRNPSTGLLASTLFTGWVPTILRAGRGMTLWGKAAPDPPPKKLELFSYENNPYARIVREALCELELPYILHNVGRGSLRTKLLLDVSGSKEVPYFVDPNTGIETGNYKMILSYLFQTYSAATL